MIEKGQALLRRSCGGLIEKSKYDAHHKHPKDRKKGNRDEQCGVEDGFFSFVHLGLG